MLLSPIVLWYYLKFLDIAIQTPEKITHSIHQKIKSSTKNVYNPYHSNYSLNFGPFIISIDKPIKESYIAYLYNGNYDNLNYNGLYLVFKPIIKYVTYPIYKSASHLKMILIKNKRAVNHKQTEPIVDG
jgi:hypothetical protein